MSGRISKSEVLRSMVLILIAAACLTATASAQQEEKESPWDWGINERVRETYIVNPFSLSDDTADDLHFFRFRTRLWGSYSPDEWWKVHAGVNNEFRKWPKTPRDIDFTWNELVFESLYIEGKKLGDTPYGFKVGRQNIFYGEGFVCWDGGPLDGSRTAYFNAALLRGDWGKRKLDAHFISNPAKDEYLPIINDQDRYLIPWDETGAGLYYTDTSFEGGKVEAYYFWKNEHDPDGVHPESDIHTIGARGTGRGWNAFDYGIEFATQVGDRGDAGRLGWGGYLWGDYEIPRDVLPLDIGLGFFALSGDDSSTTDYEGWNPVYSRWPKWSDLYIYTLVSERGVAYWENMGTGWFKLAWKTNPRINVTATMMWMWAFEAAPDPASPVFGDGDFRGMLSKVRVTWNWTDYLSGHFLWEMLDPGDYYAEGSDNSHFLRWELYFKY